MTTYDARGLPQFATTDKIAASGDGLREDLNLISASASAVLGTHEARLANLDNAAGFTGDPLSLNDAAVTESLKNGPQTSAALDASLDSKVPALVADTIANDPSVVNSAATMAQSNTGLLPVWKASTSYVTGQRVVSPDGDIVTAKANFTSGTTYSPTNWDPSNVQAIRQVTLTAAGASTDTRTAVGVGLPFKAPLNASKYRFAFRNRNPKTGVVYPGALNFTAVAIGPAQATGDNVFLQTVGNATTVEGAFTTPADGGVHYTPWVSAVALTAGTWYHLRYGYNGPAQTNYAGDGTAFTNAAPTSVLNSNPAGFTAATTAPLDVWLEVVTDAGLVRQVLYAGKPAAAPAAAPGANASSRTKLSAFGDSLTDGGANGTLWPEADSWPSKLGGQLPAVTVTNHGYSGATVGEMMFRTGIKQPRFTVVGGSIPANGYATLTTNEDLGLDPTRAYSVAGKLAGVTGMWQRLSGGELRFNTYGTVGGPATAAAGVQVFVPDTTADPSQTAIVFIGRNDVTFGIKGNEVSVADHVVGGVQRVMEWLTPQVKQVMLVGVTTGTNEPSGSANHTIITEINDRLRTLYPGKFKSVQAYLKDKALADMGLSPTADDTAKINSGTLPPSIMEGSDVIHFSKATAAALAQYFFAPYLKAKGWVD